MKKTGFVILFIFLFGCNNGPTPIQYGMEVCHFCKMTIVDNRFAAQVVTSKGKNFKFDSSECMIDYLRENSFPDMSHILVSSFDEPGTLINARDAFFLISENLSSPMGGGITAFPNQFKAEEYQEKFSGEILTWEKIIK